MKSYAYDIEVAKNFFSVVIKGYTERDKKLVFEISERANHYKALYNFFNNNAMYLIGFNNLHYDNIVINMLLKHYSEFKNTSANHINLACYRLSKAIIDDDYDVIKPYRYLPNNIKSVDLIKIWTKLIIKSKKISLKAAAGAIGFANIQDLPFDPDKPISLSEFDNVLLYNENDVDITLALADSLKNHLNLKAQVSKKYHKNFLSVDSVNMGLQVLKQEYCERMNIEKPPAPEIFINDDKLFGDYIAKNVQFETNLFQDFLNRVGNIKQPLLQQDSDDKAPLLTSKGVTYQFGIGGLHSKDKSELIKANKNHIWAIDATSYYPHLTFKYSFYPKHLDKVFLELYEEKYHIRNEAKKKSDMESKMINELYKLLLNGYTGSLKNEFSWVYDPEANFKITLNGQLFLLMLVEKLEQIGTKVISANTDGVEVMFNPNKLSDVQTIIKWWQDIVNIPLEVEEYSLIAREDVNSYFAQLTNGKVKEKGRLNTNPQLFFFHSNNFLVIPKAVQSYFLHGKSPHKEILSNRNILDFLSVPKIAKKTYNVLYNGEPQQLTNRFYVSKSGGKLYKVRKDTGRVSNIIKGYNVTLANKLPLEFPNDIHYEYYIGAAIQLIEKIDPLQTSLF